MRSAAAPKVSARAARPAVAVVVALALAGSAVAAAQPQGEPSAGSPLRVEALTVAPERPAADTLCRLVLRLRNTGARPMYAFAFDVKLGGVSMPVYDRQLFLQAIPPGEAAEVRLFNFWTTETGRPRPADGKLEVAVTVREALWLEITHEPAEGTADAGAEAEPVEVWTPAGAVPGLPLTGSLVLELAP